MTVGGTRRRRELVLRGETAFMHFLAPLLFSGWLLARLAFPTAALRAAVGALLASLVVALVLRLGWETDRGDDGIDQAGDTPRDTRPPGVSEREPRTLLGQLGFYAWALPMSATCVVIGLALMYLVPLAVVGAYAAHSDHATPGRAALAVGLSIAVVLLNEEAVIAPLCRHWGIPRS